MLSIMNFESPIIDFTNEQFNIMPYKIKQYYEAEDALNNYTEAITLFGIRRTGKTTVMQQLWEQYKTKDSAYFFIAKETTVSSFMQVLTRTYNHIDLLFIDEITRLSDLDDSFHIMLDYCKAVGIKIVCAGTDSYLLRLAQQDSAFGRLNVISFVPVFFKDLKCIRPNITFRDFCLDGIMFSKDSQTRIIADNIFNSISRSITSKSPLMGVGIDELQNAIMSIIELLIGVYSNRLPANKIKINSNKYIVDIPIVKIISPFDKAIVLAIFNIMLSLNIITVIPRYALYGNEKYLIDNLYYCTLPMMYCATLEILTGSKVHPNDKYFGMLFEATAVTQIEHELHHLVNIGSLHNAYTFSIRGEGEIPYEIDYCICTNYETLTMLEFKVSAKKNSRWFTHPDILQFEKNFKTVKKYVVYLEGETDDAAKVCITDLLFNLLKYVTS